MTDLVPLLACPLCRSKLHRAPDALTCPVCRRAFPIVDGIPLLVADGGDELKRRQASWFDEEADDELEITRPHGTPALYEWQYLEKFRRSVRGLATALSGSTALTVCGGSGMDAEFLARRGAAVISSDISLGAARRARERASRYGLSIAPIVADVERLPFADGAIDLVYVHDGLHHLAHPFDGLREMARVARLAISVNEPARAAVTALAVRLGLALEFEEAGNRVERLREREIAAALEAAGFGIVAAQRYAMYFRHEPGRVIEVLSRGPLFHLMRVGFHAVNRVAGRFGNKLTVQAIRAVPAASARIPREEVRLAR